MYDIEINGKGEGGGRQKIGRCMKKGGTEMSFWC